MAPRRAKTEEAVQEPAAEERKPQPNPRGWAHHNEAGVEMSEHREPYERWLKFRDGKPPQEVIDYMKDNGFRWNRQDEVWAKPVGYTTQATDRLVADRTYYKVVELMLKAKGVEAPEQQGQEIPF